MPVLTKKEHNSLCYELENRYEYLRHTIRSRPLNNPREGAEPVRWKYPEDMIATTGTSIEINLAIADFKTILAELKKLK